MNPQKILVLGVGELGASVVQNLAHHRERSGSLVDVMLRPESIDAPSPEKRRIHELIRSLGVNFRAGDLVEDSEADLAGVFRQYDTVIPAYV
jgi:saccharopine dehydrogenase-like NADP-dependent oxidoreductase